MDRPGQRNRPLAPAPGGTPQEAPTMQRSSAKPRVSTACEACKIRRMKCSGTAPCENCIRSGETCEIDPEKDNRRSGTVKRKLDNLERDHDLLLDLVAEIRDGQPADTMELTDFIREGASLEDLRTYIDEKLPRRDSELEGEHGEIRRQQRNAQREAYMDVRRLTDNPNIRVPARPWTTLTGDDNLVSHLISVWFTWHCPFYNWIVRDLFVADMQSGRLDCEFCSPFLVNAILAEACGYSDYAETCAVGGDVTSKGLHFWQEAKRLLDAEDGRLTIPTAQGIGVMCTSAVSIGKDRLGYLYLVQAAEAVREVQTRTMALSSRSRSSERDVKQVLSHLELGMFAAITATCVSLKRPGKMKKPSLRLPEHHDDRDNWIPYPIKTSSWPAHTNCIINQLVDLNEIAQDASEFLWGTDSHPPRASLEREVHGWHLRLLDWSKKSPKCMDPETNPIPGILTVQMYYHTLIMTFFAFLKEVPEDADERVHVSAALAKRHCLASAHAVSRLIEIQRSHWGLEPIPSSHSQWLVIALFILLDDLDNAQNQAAFLNLFRAGTYLIRQWLLPRCMFRLVYIHAKHANSTLPPDIQQLLNEFEATYWKPEDMQRLSSLYPNFARMIRQGEDGVPEDLELDRFLQMWDEVDTDPIIPDGH